MSAHVQLRAADIRDQLEAITRGRDVTKPVALYGSGVAAKIEVNTVLWDIIPVRSELELRMRLAQPDDDLAIVYLLDYDDQLPLDLLCRFMRERLFHIDRRVRLANLFGARKVAAGFTSGPLVDILLEELPAVRPIDGTVLQQDDAWARTLAFHLGLPTEETPTVHGLMRLALASPEAGRSFALRRKDPRWADFLEAAATWLARVAGPAAPGVWRVWLGRDSAEQTPEAFAAWLLLVDAARRSGDAGANQVLRQAMRYAPTAREEWLDLSEPLCKAVAVLVKEHHACLEPLQRRASQLFSEQDTFGPAYRASPWLVEGAKALQDDLAGAITTTLANPAAFPSVLEPFEALNARPTEGLPLREAGVRLLNWLCWWAARPMPEDEGWTAMGSLARWYEREGGYVDWARELLRTHATNHAGLDAALAQVVARADAVRHALDARFARVAVAWIEAGKPSTEVFPIERVLRDVAAPFLAAHAQRKLLVLMLDGLSMPVAARLFHGDDQWQPVRWAPKGRSTGIPPAIAVLPTLTATSRAAFFGGAVDPKAKPGQTEGDDPERFAGHPSLTDYATSGRPRLFLKGALGTPNALNPALRDALQDSNERIVAVVVNAIDDQLGGSSQVVVAYETPSQKAIPILEALLLAARETERAVLVVADHGHIPVQRLAGAKHAPAPPGMAAGQRWRGLKAGQCAQEGEIALPAGSWKPAGAAAVAVLVDEGRCWGTAAHGAHGGASLAETVVPVWLLAPNWLAAALGRTDEGLETQAMVSPGWWRMQRPPAAAAAERPLPVAVPAPQQTLFTAPQPTALPGPAKWHSPLTQALEDSALFRVLASEKPPVDVAQTLAIVDLLLQNGCAMSVDGFLRGLDLKARHLGGRLAIAGFLNADGFRVIHHDVLGQQVRLERAQLLTQFELPHGK